MVACTSYSEIGYMTPANIFKHFKIASCCFESHICHILT